MLKRTREITDTPASSTPPEPPSKRSHTDFSTASSVADSSPLASQRRASFSSPFSFHTPRTPFSVPSDSPNNPFGLNRSLVALSLPRAISFGKHLALRFQLVREEDPTDGIGYKRDRGGVYRVVQVPTNYSFRHLHKLILFLFASDIERRHRSMQPSIAPTRVTRSRARNGKVQPSRKALGKARAAPPKVSTHTQSSNSTEPSWRGHLFEVRRHIRIHKDSHRPGVIQSGGDTCMKLSSVRDRRLFRDFHESFTASSAEATAESEDGEDEKEQWIWEAEDDITLLHVWPDGPKLDCGIIYRHSPTVSIHITVNTLPVDPRKGIGNKPYIFLARGTSRDGIKIAHVTLNEKGEEGVPDDVDEGEETTSFDSITGPIAIKRWNTHDAFGIFLRNEADRERALQRHPIHQGSPNSRSSRQSESSDPIPIPSSDEPIALSSDAESGGYISSSEFLFPFASSAITPYPTHPAHRLRVERLGRRMERLTNSGLSAMLSSDEEDDSKGGENKDDAPSSDANGERGELEDWDPFNDEVEL